MQRTKWIIVSCVLASAACGFEGSGRGGAMQDSGVTPADGSPMMDGMPAPVPCTPWTTFFASLDPCAVDLGTPMPLTVSADSTLNTTTGMLTTGGTSVLVAGKVLSRPLGGEVRVFNVKSLRVMPGVRLALAGARNALLLVHGDATIEGTLDGSARLGELLSAPGADTPACEGQGTGGDGTDATGNVAGGGGGGAGFGEPGGDGGDGGNGGAKGVKGAKSSDTVWRGGCHGGLGGDDDQTGGEQGGRGGGGGGGVAISALGAISVVASGTATVNGAPGSAGAAAGAGAGGGGSGGGLVLDGNAVTVDGRLCANGGGGGEGGGPGGNSNPGPPVLCTIDRASGGSGGPGNGGDGGLGGARAARDGGPGNPGNSSNGGGGGGGGAVGKVWLRTRTGSPTIGGLSTISPSHALLP